MIEQYFRAGIRYLWTKPGDVTGDRDGTIVPSVRDANDLTYDGLDGHQAAVDPLLLHTNVANEIGLAMGANVPHVWLDYAEGQTAWLPIGESDILTGYMTGCLIARGTYQGAMNAFHVGTSISYPAINPIVKGTFAENLPDDATGFDPFGAWPNDEIIPIMTNLGGAPAAKPHFFALVTTAGAFYSILMFELAQDGRWTNPASYWCVGGKKLVPALDHDQLLAALQA